MAKPRIGLALGSGAARGWSHIGVIETLGAAGIVPDIVCGTSIGALVGGIYASDRLAQLKDWALTADWLTIASMMDLNLMTGGLVEGGNIVKWLDALNIAPTIEEARIPFAAVATDLIDGKEIWLQKGSLKQAIRASIALPGLLSPAHIDNHWLVDGGLTNPIPVSLCRAMGAGFVIAVSLNEEMLGRRFAGLSVQKSVVSEEKSTSLPDIANLLTSLPMTLEKQIAEFRLFKQLNASPAYFDVLMNAINIMQDHILRSRLVDEPPHVLVAPSVGDIGIMDFDRAQTCIEAGVRATELVLPEIERKLRQGA